MKESTGISSRKRSAAAGVTGADLAVHVADEDVVVARKRASGPSR